MNTDPDTQQPLPGSLYDVFFNYCLRIIIECINDNFGVHSLEMIRLMVINLFPEEVVIQELLIDNNGDFNMTAIFNFNNGDGDISVTFTSDNYHND